MSENNAEMMNDALESSIQYFLNDWPTYMTAEEIISKIEDADWDDGVIFLDDVNDSTIEILYPYNYESGSDLAQLIRTRARSYVEFATKWGAK